MKKQFYIIVDHSNCETGNGCLVFPRIIQGWTLGYTLGQP